jgi:hypothetical protein
MELQSAAMLETRNFLFFVSEVRGSTVLGIRTPDGLVVAPATTEFGFDSQQTRGNRENWAPPCVKVPGSSRVLSPAFTSA